MATADLTVIALGRADTSASRYIAEIQRRLERQDRVRYALHAMGTSLEGTTADILAVVAELHAVPFEIDIPRVYSVLKLDERRDRSRRSTTRWSRAGGCSTERAGEGNRTPILGLGSQRLNHWTTPAERTAGYRPGIP